MTAVQTTWINGLTNTYEIENGVFVKKSNLLTEAYTRIVTPIGSFPFDQFFGSYIPRWLNTRTSLSSDQVTSELSRCLQPMIANGRANYIDAQLTAPLTRNAIFFSISITDVTGDSVVLNSNYVSINNNQ